MKKINEELNRIYENINLTIKILENKRKLIERHKQIKTKYKTIHKLLKTRFDKLKKEKEEQDKNKLQQQCAETKKVIEEEAIKSFEEEGYKLSYTNQNKIIEIIKKLNNDYKQICGKISNYDYKVLIEKLQRSIKEQRDLLEKEILSLGATFENEEDLISKFKQKYNENGSLRRKWHN